MSLQLILGSSGSGKSHYLHHEIIEKSLNNKDLNYLIIVPEQFTLQTQKEIIEKHPNKGTMNIDILSFLRLSHRVFEEVGGENRSVLEDTGKSMVLRKILSMKEDELTFYGREKNKPGFINQLKSLTCELLQYSVSIEELEEVKDSLKDRPMLLKKMNDITTIYQGFQDYLADKYITAEEILDVLCDLIEKSKFLKDSIISFDGFTGFTPSQYKLLGLLMKQAKKVIITVTIDQREDISRIGEEFKLFHLSKKTIHRLYEIAMDNKIEIDKPIYPNHGLKKEVFRFRQNPALASLEKNLFRYPFYPYEKEQDNIQIHVAKSKNQEVQFVVKETMKLVREEGYRYQDIAIITGEIKEFASILEREFDQANIPCFIDHKRELLNNPFVEFLRSMLDIFKNNFDYESIFRFLRCGLLDYSMDELDILENYIIAFGIRGRNRWSKEWTKVYKGQEEGQLNIINKIRSELMNDLDPLAQMFQDKNKTVRDYTIGIYQYIVQQDIEKKLEDYKDKFEEKAMFSMAKEYQQVYEIVINLFEKLVELLGDEVLSLQDYIEILEAGLSEEKVGVIPPGLDQILVGDIERTRLRDVKAVFFIGVNDGILPKSNRDGGVLSDLDREILLSHCNLEIAPTRRQVAYMEQFNLYLNLTKPKERLYLSYSKLDQEGKTIRPSYLIGVIQKLFPLIQVIDEERLEDTIEHVVGSDKGMEYLIKGLRDYQDRKVTDYWRELFNYYKKEEEGEKIINKLIQGAFYSNDEIKLNQTLAKELYGESLLGSVTRFEQYAACPFSHYVKYGLNLQERVEYRLAAFDIGNLFHDALEVYSKKVHSSEYDWHNLPLDIQEAWAEESVMEAVEDGNNSIFSSSKRYQYIVTRAKRIMKKTIWALGEQIKKGDFEPAEFEVFFSGREELDSLQLMLSKDSGINLRGRIDRLDLYEESNRLMVRVIDYKSGKTKFDLLSVYYGLQLQLAIYLNAALEFLKKNYPDKEIIPAGVFYYNIDDPIVEKNSNVTESTLKLLRMNGIVNHNKEVIKHLDNSFKSAAGDLKPSVSSDVIPVGTNKDSSIRKGSNVVKEEDLKAMEGFITEVVKDFGYRILTGDTRIKPYRLKKQTACEYCPYSGVCGFEPNIDGFDYRKLMNYTDKEIWEKIYEKQDWNQEGDQKS